MRQNRRRIAVRFNSERDPIRRSVFRTKPCCHIGLSYWVVTLGSHTALSRSNPIGNAAAFALYEFQVIAKIVQGG